LFPEFVSGDNFRLLSSLAIPVGTGLCGWVAENSRPIINGNPAVEVGFAHDQKNASEPQAALVVPLEGSTGLVGVLALYQAEADSFTSEHLRVLQVITSRVAFFIENALKYRAAEESATVDYLTGMANARSISLHLEQELARCKREGSSLAVIVCDLNGFKQINDSYGHLAGDKVLKLFSSYMLGACRDYDYAARMGGDEFVIVAPNMTASTVAERAVLLSSMAKLSGREVCDSDQLSLSLGAAFYPLDGIDSEKLLAEADRRMYAAKHAHYAKSKLAPIDVGQSPSLNPIHC